MSAYTVYHATPGGTTLPLINLTGSATMQAKLYEVILGTKSAPADTQAEVVVGLTTDVGSGGTTLSENALNAGQTPAATCAAVGGTFSGAPTFTANSGRLYIGFAQRASWRWYVNDLRHTIRSILSANNGLEAQCLSMSSGTPTITCQLSWEE